MRNYLVFVLIILMFTILSAEAFCETTYADLANPLVGTKNTYELSHGNIYPSISIPFAMTAWTPQTEEDRWIYKYQDTTIQGIRGTHSPSIWVGDYGNINIMAITGKLKTKPKERASKFTHKNEIAKPYYYLVYLDNYDIKMEMTPTERCAFFRFTFPDNKKSYILLDNRPHHGYFEIIPEENMVIGYNSYGGRGNPKNFRCYFAAKFDKNIKSYGTYNNLGKFIDSKKQWGDGAGAFIKFDNTGKVKMQIATSFISYEQAKLNLERELPSTDFEDAKNKAKDKWNRELGRIEITGGTEKQKRTFYTNMYRLMIFPRGIYELDKNGSPMHYSPYDGKVHKGVLYADTGFWDTFRAQFPLFTIIMPKRDAEIIRGLLNAYDEGGWLPKWPSPGYRNIMIGTHADSVIADAYVKGIRDFDGEKAFEAMLKNAQKKGDKGYDGRLGIDYYLKSGYVPCDMVKESASRTLEFAYDDYCVALMAKELGKEKYFRKFFKSSKNYLNLFDKKNRLFRGKNIDGYWKEPFSPIEWGGPFCEGCAWHYLWSVQHNIEGLIELVGGKKEFTKRLDVLFNSPPDFKVGTYKKVIHEMTEMVNGKMGLYAHGNEPVHHVIYLYNYVEEPWKTQKLVRQVLDNLYGYGPEGYPGDEDNGQMSAWYIFSAMGFYPVCPGKPVYDIGSPLFPETKINLENGKKFIIKAYNNSPENMYVQSIKLNGNPLKRTWIKHSEIMKGGILEFEMGPTPK